MLKSHLNTIEAALMAQSQTAANAGHPNLRGGPREWFIESFLSTHLPSNLEIGQGEIIDAKSVPGPSPGDYRPQVDIVLYRRDVPKISYSPRDRAYLAEGVMATIEVKSTLTEEELFRACRASAINKALDRRHPGILMGGGWRPESIVSYVVAFDGPIHLATVAGWMPGIVASLSAPAQSVVDMVAVLGKGLLWRINAFPAIQFEESQAAHTWAYVNQRDQNVFSLFVHMLTWMGWASSPPSLGNYATKLELCDVGTY